MCKTATIQYTVVVMFTFSQYALFIIYVLRSEIKKNLKRSTRIKLY